MQENLGIRLDVNVSQYYEYRLHIHDFFIISISKGTKEVLLLKSSWAAPLLQMSIRYAANFTCDIYYEQMCKRHNLCSIIRTSGATISPEHIVGMTVVEE